MWNRLLRTFNQTFKSFLGFKTKLPPKKRKKKIITMPPPPPNGLSGVPLCLFPGAAGLPLTSRWEDLLSRGLLDNRLSPLSILSCGLTLSWSLGLSVPLSAPRSCSIPLEMLRGALGTVFGAGRKKKEKEFYLYLIFDKKQFASRP